MDQISEIQIYNFRESLKLSEKAVFTGLFVSIIVYYTSYTKDESHLPKIPFFDFEFHSLETFQFSLLILYIASGLLSWYSSNRALQILSTIKDEKIASELSRYPSIIVSNTWFSSFLAGALYGIGYLLLSAIYNFDNIFGYSLYFVVSIPFYITLKIGNKINDWYHLDINKTS